MDYLSRGSAPFTQALWDEIDATVVKTAKDTLVGRRFLPLYGPLGASATTAIIDSLNKEESYEDGFVVTNGRQTVQIPQLYQDFTLNWRDLATTGEGNADLSSLQGASQLISRREDEMIFYGVKNLGVKGLVNSTGVNTQKRSDWSAGEGAFSDIATAIATLGQNGCFGNYTLVVSLDLYVQLQRIQQGTGLLESERISQLLNGKLFASPVLQPKTAMLLCAQQQYMDLLVGQDFVTAYTELVDLNHHLRILETALPRVKEPKAIVVFK